MILQTLKPAPALPTQLENGANKKAMALVDYNDSDSDEGIIDFELLVFQNFILENGSSDEDLPPSKRLKTAT